MGTTRMNRKLAATLVALGGAGAASAAAPTPQQMLQFQPKQPGVVIATPTEAELATHKVELVNGPGTATGWALKDARGNLVRKFVASKGNAAGVDTYSYFLDGAEVYRETDTNNNKKVDTYRWFGPGGSKWGVDLNEDGRIDGWRAISAEEVSQELLQAVITRDTARFQALLINGEELKSLDLSPTEAARVRDAATQAPAKFQQITAKLIGLGEKTHWLHLETAAPQCVSTETSGAKREYTKYANGTILYESAGKHDWLQTGELIQVGSAWRLVDAPATGHASDMVARGTSGGGAIQVDEKIKPILEQLKALDAQAPKVGGTGAALVTYNRQRAAIIQKIVDATTGDEREQWVKQVADSLGAAAQNSEANDRSALDDLARLKAKVADQPALAGYIAYREISAEYAKLLANPGRTDMAKIQEGWRDKLKAFVTAYPAAEDTADALIQLGMVSEFVGKETEAKTWYGVLVEKHGKNPLAAKAAGALARLDLDGKPLDLKAAALAGGQPFDIASLRGRSPAIVYYWASWNAQCASDFTKLKALLEANRDKGLQLVCVNLDSEAAQATAFLGQNVPNAPGIHLYQAGGLDSAVATQYGVMVLPNLFLVAKDGKVASRSVQMTSLEDEVKKLLDK